MSTITRPTDECRHARVVFYRDLCEFLRKDRFPSEIEWGPYPGGGQYTPEILFDHCYQPLFEKILTFMKHPDRVIDRHKVIAATQAVILRYQPLRFVATSTENENNYELNADFAFQFGIRFMCTWNQTYYPKNNFQFDNNKFDVDKFVFPLLHTEEGVRFIDEHSKYLASNPHPFPVFAVANIWFLIEQWCLMFARHQKGWPKENEPLPSC